ncbi:MAG: carbonic anhydrase family protein [Bacteroidales bacterium]|jgi:carbonic anhydrase
MTNSTKNTLFVISLFALLSCQSPVQQNIEAVNKPETQVLTAKEQGMLTPETVIGDLKKGNARFTANDLTPRDYPVQAKNSAKAQYPQAVILSCLDSRVPVEQVFDQGIGDVFVARVAGNIVNNDILGSMEYGCKVSGSKLIVVLGHQSCGAVKSAIAEVELGNITTLLDKIQPAIAKSQDFTGEKSADNYDFVDYVGEMNVLVTMESIREQSPILKEMEEKGEIKIVGAFYDLHTGAVEFLEN